MMHIPEAFKDHPSIVKRIRDYALSGALGLALYAYFTDDFSIPLWAKVIYWGGFGISYSMMAWTVFLTILRADSPKEKLKEHCWWWFFPMVFVALCWPSLIHKIVPDFFEFQKQFREQDRLKAERKMWLQRYEKAIAELESLKSHSDRTVH